MLRKGIKSVLAKKFGEWVDSITDPGVQKLVKENTIITGGAIVSLLLGEKVSDFDVYFRDKATVLAVANYYVEKWNKAHESQRPNGDIYRHVEALVVDGATYQPTEGEKRSALFMNLAPERVKIVIRSCGVAGENEEGEGITTHQLLETLDTADQIPAEALESAEETGELIPDPEPEGNGKKPAKKSKEKYRPIFLSPNAITLSDKIQLVIRFYGTPDMIHSTYDFIHCTCYYIPDTGELCLPAEALESILGRVLIYRGSKYPLCSVIRTRKFIRRGWIVNAGQYLKMLFQVSELNLRDVATLEDQLVGVDTVYFLSLIDELRKQQELNPNFNFGADYICSLVDKIFG